MIEIPIPKKLKISGFTWRVVSDEATDEYLKNCNPVLFGECDYLTRTIKIRTDIDAQRRSEVFIHEVNHTTGCCNEDAVDRTTSGTFQVLEQLGVRFV